MFNKMEKLVKNNLQNIGNKIYMNILLKEDVLKF